MNSRDAAYEEAVKAALEASRRETSGEKEEPPAAAAGEIERKRRRPDNDEGEQQEAKKGKRKEKKEEEGELSVATLADVYRFRDDTRTTIKAQASQPVHVPAKGRAFRRHGFHGLAYAHCARDATAYRPTACA